MKNWKYVLIALLCGFVLTAATDVFGQEAQRRRKDHPTFSSTVKDAIRQADNISKLDKLKLRVLMAVKPGVKEAVEEYMLEKVNESGEIKIASVDAKIDLDQFERLLQILIEYLPALIEIFVGLFGSVDPIGSVLYASTGHVPNMYLTAA